MKKKLIGLALSAAMLFSVLSVPAFAAAPEESADPALTTEQTAAEEENCFFTSSSTEEEKEPNSITYVALGDSICAGIGLTTVQYAHNLMGVGISTGLGYGDNARAALITRGIAELARLGVAMGCNVHTFAGLAGIGDLIVTATSMHSRNNRAGILIGKGETPEQAVKEVGMVVEGMNALPAALELAAKYQVEMPIVQTVNAVVNKGMSAAEAVRSLMDRDPKNELPQDYEK